MKIFLFLVFSVLCSESYNMQLLSYMSFGQDCADITGFYQDDREFAVIGLQNAAAIVDITDPYNPFEIDRIEGSTSIWRDLKYWNRHVYIGTEADDGIKVVSVDDPDNPILVNTITDVDNSHNIHVDSDGYLYIVGADINDIWIYSLLDPGNPELVGTWNLQNGETSSQGYCHDIEVYNNKLYCAAIYVGYFHIIDVTDKSNPLTITSHFTGTDGISTHDVAVTEDENYLFTGDENLSGHIKVWDISNYSNINLVNEWFTPEYETHSAHNLYVKEGTNQLFISYYADGTRVLDISNPLDIEEIAFYDMSDLEGLYVSNWGTYVDLPSGNIISSDIELGLFVLELGGVSIDHQDVQDIDLELESPYVLFSADVESFDGVVENVTLHYSLDNQNWDTINMSFQGENLYQTVMTFDQANVIVYYYITATNSLNQSSKYPQLEDFITFNYGDLFDIVLEDFENGTSWYVESDASAGLWELGIPNGSVAQGLGFLENDFIVQTDEDHSENGEYCFVTGNAEIEITSPGQDDVDGGSTILYSDYYDLESYNDVLLSYWRWYTNNYGNNPGNDIWNVQVSSNGGLDWTNLEYTAVSLNVWHEKTFVLSNFIDLTNQVQFRFIASDLFNTGDNGSGGSLVEAAIDDFKLEIIGYESLLGDLNFDSNIDILDIVILVNLVLTDDYFNSADFNSDQILNILDVVSLVNAVLGDM